MEDLYAGIVDIRTARLDPAAALAFVSDARFGGIALFVGRVRNHNLGRIVTGITYDLFEPLVLKTFRAIDVRARAEVGEPLKLYVAHAKGDLGLEDLAVLVAAGTPHRDEAFRACRLAIEVLKHEAPIWKQEHYLDGDSGWSEGCSLCEAAPATERAPAGSHTNVGHVHGH
ncbi:MAG: molybdenum cofactor biosynthesis protein MoaE [Rhodanobacteraceae bacterium]|nr:MAG: molybdenum cofactor biosynthesis protein MoaE [Rhodanobacteraceae bacterium]